MPDIAAQAASRPWYRLHRSSIVVLLLVLSAVTVWNVSAFHYLPPYRGTFSWRHGWPATFVTREIKGFLAADLWAIGSDVRSFYPAMLVLDVCVAVSLAVFSAMLFEWRRRRRSRVSSVSLKEFFVLAAIAAGMLGVWYGERANHQELRRIVEALGGTEQINGTDQLFPRWLWKWLPGDGFKLGDTPVAINFRKLDNPEKSLAQLPKLTDVRWLMFIGLGPYKVDEHAEVLRQMGQLEVLFLAGTDFSNQSMAHLAGLHHLRHLRLPYDITGDGLVHLKGLTQLEELSFDTSPPIVWDKPQITDAGFQHFANLSGLKRLQIFTGKLTSAGTKHLQGLSKLTQLDLSADLRDEALEPIGKMKSLGHLNLNAYEMTDAGVIHLQSLTNLKNLLLQNTKITDRGLETLSKMTALEELYLNSSFGDKVTNVGIEHLRKLPRLKVLNLSGTGITDGGLNIIGDFPNLREIWLPSTAVTPEGRARLQQRRPELSIH